MPTVKRHSPSFQAEYTKTLPQSRRYNQNPSACVAKASATAPHTPGGKRLPGRSLGTCNSPQQRQLKVLVELIRRYLHFYEVALLKGRLLIVPFLEFVEINSLCS